jgi:hypothetical protein
MTTLILSTTLPLACRTAASGLNAAAAVGLSRPLLGALPRYGPSADSYPAGTARHFSSTPPAALKVKQWFPPPQLSRIKYAGPAWEHPVYVLFPDL